MDSDNYGAACRPESQRTTFDEAAGTAIFSGTAPFVGSFRPTQSLAVFQGQNLANLSGTWRLRATDVVTADTGTIQCWTLNIKLRSPVITESVAIGRSFLRRHDRDRHGAAFQFLRREGCIPPDVRIGGVPVSVLTWSSTSVTGTVPARFAGPADVTVTDYWSRSGTLTDAFTYVGAAANRDTARAAGPERWPRIYAGRDQLRGRLHGGVCLRDERDGRPQRRRRMRPSAAGPVTVRARARARSP